MPNVQFKLLIDELLLKRLRKEGAKNGHSANQEAIERLEQSFGTAASAARDRAVIGMLVGHDGVNSKILRDIADEIATHPDWDQNEAARKELVGWLYITAHGKDPAYQTRPGEEQ